MPLCQPSREATILGRIAQFALIPWTKSKTSYGASKFLLITFNVKRFVYSHFPGVKRFVHAHSRAVRDLSRRGEDLIGCARAGRRAALICTKIASNGGDKARTVERAHSAELCGRMMVCTCHFVFSFCIGHVLFLHRAQGVI